MGYASYCNSSRSVECPQCQTKYRFVFPKLSTHVKLLIMANQLCDSGVTALVISGLFYSANLGRRRRHRFTLSETSQDRVKIPYVCRTIAKMRSLDCSATVFSKPRSKVKPPQHYSNVLIKSILINTSLIIIVGQMGQQNIPKQTHSSIYDAT